MFKINDLIFKIRSYFLDPSLFSHFPASTKIRSDLKNKIAGASGCVTGRGRSEGQTAGGHPKASLGLM